VVFIEVEALGKRMSLSRRGAMVVVGWTSLFECFGVGGGVKFCVGWLVLTLEIAGRAGGFARGLLSFLRPLSLFHPSFVSTTHHRVVFGLILTGSYLLIRLCYVRVRLVDTARILVRHETELLNRAFKLSTHILLDRGTLSTASKHTTT
jgi:hypothetical protein